MAMSKKASFKFMLLFMNPEVNTARNIFRFYCKPVERDQVVHQPARSLPPPGPNIKHQAQCDPGVNISAKNDINVLRNTTALENPFPISSANQTAPALTASVRGTFVLPLYDGSTCDIPMYYCPSLTDTIVLPQHFTSSAIHERWYNGYCLIDIPGFCCH
jgi:hypothetical protein